MFVNLNRPEFRHVLFRGETGVPAIGERDDPNRDQNDPENAGWLHETEGLNPAASRNQIDNQDDDGDDEDQVDQPAADMADEAEEPENQKHNKDSPEHMFSLGWFLVRGVSRNRVKATGDR
jgi:hypothetical protein